MKDLLKPIKPESERNTYPQMGGKHSSRYNYFRDLLDHNRRALTLMADFEQTYYANRAITTQRIKREYDELHSEVEAIIKCLEQLSGKDLSTLSGVLSRVQRTVHEELSERIPVGTRRLVMPLEEVNAEHFRVVGAKAGNLAVIQRDLGLPVPQGFVATASSYERFLSETGLAAEIDASLAEIQPDDLQTLETASRQIQTRVMETSLPESIGNELVSAYHALEQRVVPGVLVAVRSSAVGEDSETSFAGQYRSVLNVTKDNLLEAYKTVVAGKYSVSALSYRIYHGLDDSETPMCVLVLAMVDAQQSGVLYTADPVSGDLRRMKINAVVGLGEALVGGEASAQATYVLDKEQFQLLEHISDAPEREPTTRRDSSPHQTEIRGANGDDFLRTLWEYATILEEHFQRPLDIEWAVDRSGQVYLVQSRPLLLFKDQASDDSEQAHDFPGHDVLIVGGRCVSAGVAAGKVVILRTTEPSVLAKRLEEDVILVAKTASPEHAKLISKAKGIITDIGSVTSHLASVAREFGVPALFGAQSATSILSDGEEITLWANHSKVLRGVVDELVRTTRQLKRPIFASPAHLRMQAVLDSVSPLNLTNPQDPAFSPGGCQTVHDVIRFTHEQAMREMFGYGEIAERVSGAIKLKMSIPLWLYVIDVGGGLREGLTGGPEAVDAHCITSIPFRAVLRGLSHPGINWTGAIGITAKNLMTLVAGAAGPQQSDILGSASYAIVSQDYLNLNARFGYHFATVDALCGDDLNQNYVTLQFAGGVGSYYGRSLRIQFLANVLQRLGFSVQVKGDLIEASFSRIDRHTMETALDQMGRLLGCSRLLDMGIANPEDVALMTESFFHQDYNFLERKREDEPREFYISIGKWRRLEREGRTLCLQDGSEYGTWVSSKVAGVMGRFFGSGYQEFLDNIHAYYYFPLAIAKESSMENGTVSVKVRPVSGSIDQAGGIAFGIRDLANYFAFRINALENNAILFEFKNSKRIQLVTVDTPIRANVWHTLQVDMDGSGLKAYLNGQLVIEYETNRTLDGYVGLWTKADSVTEFDSLETSTPEGARIVVF
jgi:pyruvate, water dikinase